jgi:hypothetical protein
LFFAAIHATASSVSALVSRFQAMTRETNPGTQKAFAVVTKVEIFFVLFLFLISRENRSLVML